MKITVKKCECGRVTNPIQLSIVENAWVKNGIEYYQFKCPQCRKNHIIRMTINEK